MANHGQIAIGPSLEPALELAAEVETLSEQYCKALMIGGAHVLTRTQMRDVLDRFASYGQQQEPEARGHRKG
jgi:L-fuculose-phosphate aldolase